MAKSMKPTVEDERRWQAESIVRKKLEQAPEYKKAVKQTMKEIKKMEANIKVTPKKKG